MKVTDTATGTMFELGTIEKYGRHILKTKYEDERLRSFITIDGQLGVACYSFTNEEIEKAGTDENLFFSDSHIDFVDTDFDQDSYEFAEEREGKIRDLGSADLIDFDEINLNEEDVVETNPDHYRQSFSTVDGRMGYLYYSFTSKEIIAAGSVDDLPFDADHAIFADTNEYDEDQ